MRIELYCIYDDLGEKASPPFAAENDEVAVRQYRTLLDEVPAFARKDFKLFRIGLFDFQSMDIMSDSPVEIDTIRRFEAELNHE